MTVDPEKYEWESSSMKNAKAIGVLWGVFTVCFAIIDVVVFMQPHWLGDGASSPGTGHFGLWAACHRPQDGFSTICEGRLTDFGSIPAPAFRAATVFVGLSVVIALLSVACMMLFFVFHSSTVFHICGWMQLFCAACLSIGVLSFPAGWGSPAVRGVCGVEAAAYSPGACGLRWAFVLAVIGAADCAVLAALAFVLGTKYVKLLPDQYVTTESLYKGEINSAFITDSSRKASNLHSAMGTPPMDSDRYSEYSHRSNKAFRTDNSVTNFQL